MPDRAPVGFSVPLDLRKKLEARADAEDASMSMVAIDALRAHLDGDGVT